ncbi:MAG: hypothetical protein F6K40_05830 [Okeania sp. SIO3I5]|uniref:hypothetical protein n=1 Tax=Okeania sp. SIO3I5 TaxID=2607805 RepID=UPI0013BBF2AD|nr:hypothetical protein [Okeania sp. SIO3I5]NEQ35828.1 hypothetical protein [Okeania sp. SIO3I5]
MTLTYRAAVEKFSDSSPHGAGASQNVSTLAYRVTVEKFSDSSPHVGCFTKCIDSGV